jgi:hypothetical protein
MQTETPRAPRLTLTVPITYRKVGDQAWLHGRVVNVSESGVMFGPAAVEAGQSIEVIFSTPIPIASIAPGKLFCTGHVVRTAASGVAAAHFEECRFLLESVR